MKSKKKLCKKLISLMLVFMMIFIQIPSTVLASAKSTPQGVPIRTQEELENISVTAQSRYYLANDIELTGEWTPLPEFRGIFDGNGHKITGLNITQGEGINDGYDGYNFGLFAGIIGVGEVKNLGIEGNIHISDEYLDQYTVGINAGLLAGIVSNSYNSNGSARIKNVWVKGSVTSDSKIKQQYIAGLVGNHNDGSLENCYSAVKDAPIIGLTTISVLSNIYYDKDIYDGPGITNIYHAATVDNLVGKTTKDMQSQDFVDLLNKNKGESFDWIKVDNDYPRQEFVEAPEVKNYEIRTEEELMSINDDLSGNYTLMNDIELTSDNWAMIGSKSNPFAGTLDGNGYVIKNLKYSGNDVNIGLISYSTGKIKNLGIENATMISTDWQTDDIGIIVGTNVGTIENCYVIDATIDPFIASKSGLIAGNNQHGMIKNCYVVGSGSKGAIAVGNGNVGDTKDHYENCYYDSTVFGTPRSNYNGIYAKTTKEMKSADLVDKLNTNKGNNLKWFKGENGYPSMQNKIDENPEINEDKIKENMTLMNDISKNISSSFTNTKDPWAITSMVANGKKSELTNIEEFIIEAYNAVKDATGKDPYTIEKYIIALSAIGVDARNLSNGTDTINAIESLGSTNIDLINAMIFGLIAYDSGDYEIPGNSPYTREELINTILEKQTSRGGWSFSGRNEEADMTAMALSALAPYYTSNNAKSANISEETYNKVKIAIDKAVDLLGEMKLSDGSYSTDESAPYYSNSNSTSMVIMALSALGIDVQRDVRFIQNGSNPIDGLFKFATSDKVGFGFRDNTLNLMSTEQGFRALVSYTKFVESGEGYNLYLCNKGFIDTDNPQQPEVPEKPEVPEQPEVSEKPVINGAEDITINVGEKFDPIAGVTATDKEDGDMTSSIVIYGTVDTSKAGIYAIRYEVTDSHGNTVIKDINVTVKEVETEVPTEKEIIKVGIYTDENALYESIEVEYKENDTAYSVLKRIFGDKVIVQGENENIYVKSINGLAEFDKGPLSGWIYSVNRVKPGESAGVYTLNPNDELIWHYTLDLGEDITNSFDKFDEFIKENDDTIPPVENQAPVIIANNIEVKVGDSFDPMKNISSSDNEDGDLTDKIKVVKNTVNTNKAGNYEVVYEVSDSKGLTTTRTIIVTVTAKANKVDISTEKLSVSNWVLNNLNNPGYGDEWKILGLVRGNIKVPNDLYKTYYKNLVNTLKEKNGVLHKSKYSEYSRVVITLTALGYDPTNVGGYNLVEKLYNYDNVSKQGINGVIFALIALDTKDFEIKGNNNSRDILINSIISKQLSDGGFNLSGSTGDVDITAMAIQALAKYKNQSNVKSALDKAINFLSKSQLSSGGFGTSEGETAESNAQVLIALNALGIDVNDKRFIKDGNSMIDAIMRFKTENGGFKHLLTQTDANYIATEQVMLAIVSQERVKNTKTSLYDMSDIKLNGEKPETTPNPTPDNGEKPTTPNPDNGSNGVDSGNSGSTENKPNNNSEPNENTQPSNDLEQNENTQPSNDSESNEDVQQSNDSQQNENTQTSNSPQTSDTSMLPFIIIATLTMGAILVLKKRKVD